ncbi:MAG: cysteine desulfurase family protein, partial [Dehalococcoidia bacterium]
VLDRARRGIASLLGAKPGEIIFTAGGSEADNLALCGIARAAGRSSGQIITSAVEHHAVLHAAHALEREGFRVDYLPVDGQGLVDPRVLEAAVGSDTILVSIMHANNEVGTIQPIAELAGIVKAKNPGAYFHTDAVQSGGLLSLNVERLHVDALSLAAHKFYGPKGIGALYLRSGTPLQPQLLGGAQEKDRRAGTENVAGAVGLAEALAQAYAEQSERLDHLRPLRDRLLRDLPRMIAGLQITGPLDGDRRLVNSVSCCIEGIEAETLLLQLDLAGIAASSGSACTSGSLEPSHVLTAMGIDQALARGSLRLTLGQQNTMADVGEVLAVLPGFVARLRDLAAERRLSASTARL